MGMFSMEESNIMINNAMQKTLDQLDDYLDEIDKDGSCYVDARWVIQNAINYIEQYKGLRSILFNHLSY